MKTELREFPRPTTPGTLSTIFSRYSKILNCAFVRANESILVARLGHFEEGARATRGVTVRAEEAAEAAAHF